MINTLPDKLRDEVRGGTQFRDKFLQHVDRLVMMLTGRYYRSDKTPDRAVTENHAYEYLSVMLPSIIFDNPRVRIQVSNPGQPDDLGLMTYGQRAKAIELALNRWSEDSGIYHPLYDVAVDMMFSFGVLMTTTVDQPGYSGAEMVPQRPFLINISPRHFLLDPLSRSENPLQHGGPRWLGHQWKADKEDLLGDDAFDREMVMKVAQDTDIEKYDEGKNKSNDIPMRNEIVCWDIWVPEKRMGDDPAMNGTIYTIAAGANEEGMTKKTRYLRPPRPAYCPPWGPYTMFGGTKVPGVPFPMSPLVATAEISESLNAHTTAAAEDAKAYKKFVAYQIQNAADGDRVKSVRNGEMVGLDDVENIVPVELGGVSPAQYTYMQQERERLARVSGLSDSMRGIVSGGPAATATQEALASAGSNVRIDGIKRQYRKSVSQVFKSAAWYLHYGDDVKMPLGPEGAAEGMTQYMGGIYPGMEDFDFFDMSFEIDPLSMEHTNQAVYQKRLETAISSMNAMIPQMQQIKWVHWEEPMRALFESLNIGHADEWFDFEALKQEQAMIEQMNMGMSMGVSPTKPADTGSSNFRLGNPKGAGKVPAQMSNMAERMTGQPAGMKTAQQIGSQNGALARTA